MAGAITVVEATTMDGVEAIIVVITIGETSLPLMLVSLGEAAFGRLFFGRACLLLGTKQGADIGEVNVS
jgi:hypothetical protein